MSGRGDDVRTINLSRGVWFCDVSVSGNAGAYGASNFVIQFTGRNGGFDLLANEIESNWSARKRVSVGDGLFDFGPGTIDVEVTAEGSWRLSCEAQTSTSSASSGTSSSSASRSRQSGGASREQVRLSGRGDGVQTMTLQDGVWFCDVSVTANAGAYGADNFVVELTGRNGGFDLLANEIESQWSARKRISVGDGIFDFGEGTIDVEVTAVGQWEIDCVRQ